MSAFTRYLLSTFLVLSVAAGLAAGTMAAAPTGTVSGTISDPNGAAVAGVLVTATNATTGTALQTKTNDKGFYSFESLPTGVYALSVEWSGAKAVKATDLALEADKKLVANATIEIAALAQPVAAPPPPAPAAAAPQGQQTPVLDAPVDSTNPQALLDRIKTLEGRVLELESTTVLSEPETRVRRLEVYVDEAGNVYDQPTPGAKKEVTYQRERSYRRQTINEKIEEAIEGDSESRVQVGVDASITAQYVKQTKGETAPADNNFYELASADLFFTARVAQHTLFFADIVGLSGPSLDLEVGGFTLLNGYTARLVEQNDISLREAWLRTELFSQRLALVAGRLDLTNYFDNNAGANDETTQFIADALVNNPMLGLSENGAGMALIFDPKIGFSLKFGFQQSNSAATNMSDSLFTLSEIGFVATPLSLGEGNYRGWFRTDNTVGTTRTGWGISLDQKLTSQVTLFGRYGQAQTDAKHDRFYSGGLQFSNGLGFYPGDTWGVGYAQPQFGTGDREHVVEGYYNVGLTERLRLSFYLQHALEKPVGGETTSFLVPGVRLQASF